MKLEIFMRTRTVRGKFMGSLSVAGMLVALIGQTRAAEVPATRPVTDPSLRAASEAAAADQSLVLLVFSATWCGPCKLLKSQTLDSPDFLERGGTLHIVDVDVDADAETARKFDVSSIPALFLLTGDGKIVAHQVGFISALDLIDWIEKGRAHVKVGEWEGTAPGAKFNEFLKKAAGDGLNTNDIQRLISMLGDADAGDRATGMQIVLAQRESAVPLLIEAISDPYLGTRISASDLLQQLAPDAPVSDPWQSASELKNSVVFLKKWWMDTGKLPPPHSARSDAATQNSIKAMIDSVRGDNPSQRTDSMGDLVRQGSVALPLVRDAIRKSERLGDQRTVLLLEDVRWAILVPDELERKTAGVRNVLSRGKSQERQEAALHLGKAGREGLNALTELLGDADPLVVESAIRAVSDIGARDSIPALAALLQAGDSNLRMTAAQALGHTQNPDAIKPLLPAFIDPNEVVACTALGALEEIETRNDSRSSKTDLSADATTALRTTLSDSRWRVRATAVEIIGKIQVRELAADVKKLLDDNDGFVVKNALAALTSLGGAPDAAQLVAIGNRLHGLRSDTVTIMLQNESEDTIKTVTEVYNSGSVDDQLSILKALSQREDSSGDDKLEDGWKPMLARASTATDPRLRRAAATVLSTEPPKLAAEYLAPLLADDDSQTRRMAAEVVLNVLNGKQQERTRFGWTEKSSGERTNKSVASPAQLSAWHTALVQHLQPDSGLSVAVAVFATGDGKSDLPLMEKALANSTGELAQLRDEAGMMNLMLSKLPWPEGKNLLDRISETPALMAMAASQSAAAPPEIADYLLDPGRLKSALEPLSGEKLKTLLELLAGNDNERSWSLWLRDDRTRAVNLALVDSTNAAWRSAAVFALGLESESEKDIAYLDKAVADPNPWVRAAAAASLSRQLSDQSVLEQRVAPLLADTNGHVVAVAAVALLQPEVRQAAGIERELDYFQFEGHSGGSTVQRMTSDRPLIVLDRKPEFLQTARKWLPATNAEGTGPCALLLAQYGEFDGLDQLISRQMASRSNTRNFVLAGVALSHDPKYIPTLRQIANSMHDEWDLRRILQALKGMTGPEARQLRLDINKQIRESGNASGSQFID